MKAGSLTMQNVPVPHIILKVIFHEWSPLSCTFHNLDSLLFSRLFKAHVRLIWLANLDTLWSFSDALALECWY